MFSDSPCFCLSSLFVALIIYSLANSHDIERLTSPCSHLPSLFGALIIHRFAISHNIAFHSSFLAFCFWIVFSISIYLFIFELWSHYGAKASLESAMSPGLSWACCLSLLSAGVRGVEECSTTAEHALHLVRDLTWTPLLIYLSSFLLPNIIPVAVLLPALRIWLWFFYTFFFPLKSHNSYLTLWTHFSRWP